MQWLIALAFGGCAVVLVWGHQTGYPDAMTLQRVIGVLVLAAFALTFVRGPRELAR
jgi:hypothetical protein